MAIRTPICDLFGIEHPIVLGGMMGISDGRLTGAVSEAGGLGTLSTATFGPDGTRQEIEKITSLTDRPFSLNLPIFHPMVPELVKLVEEFGVKIVTCSAGSPDKYTRQLKDAGATVIHVVSSLRTALKAEAAQVGGRTGGLRPIRCNLSTPAGSLNLYPYVNATQWRPRISRPTRRRPS